MAISGQVGHWDWVVQRKAEMEAIQEKSSPSAEGVRPVARKPPLATSIASIVSFAIACEVGKLCLRRSATSSFFFRPFSFSLRTHGERL